MGNSAANLAGWVRAMNCAAPLPYGDVQSSRGVELRGQAEEVAV